MDAYGHANRILAENFIPPEQIARACGIAYSPESLKMLERTLPSEDDLLWLHDNNFMLVAGPPNPMSLLEIREFNPAFFCVEAGGWYEYEKFSRGDKAPVGWLAMHTKSARILSDAERFPNAAELAWVAITYLKASYCLLLDYDIYVPTSSMDSGGNFVSLGLLFNFPSILEIGERSTKEEMLNIDVRCVADPAKILG